MKFISLGFICVCIYIVQDAFAFPEQGIFNGILNQSIPYYMLSKTLLNRTMIALKVDCMSDYSKPLKISWTLRWTPCLQAMMRLNSSIALRQFDTNPDFGTAIECKESSYCFYQRDEFIIKPSCKKGYLEYITASQDSHEVTKDCCKNIVMNSTDVVTKQVSPPAAATSASRRRRREAEMEDVTSGLVKVDASSGRRGESITKTDHQVLTRTYRSGTFLFMVSVSPEGASTMTRAELEADKFIVSVEISTRSDTSGYLSANDFPLLICYALLSVVYSFYGLFWLIYCACYWRDLLRIQFWIGGVIALGLLEKAVLYGEYSSVMGSGRSVRGALVFAELVSALKRALARMLVIIVSVGFGIIKPRLGPTLHKVLGVGGIFFICASIEGCIRVLAPAGDPDRMIILALIPLAVIDAGICWWIFTALAQTLRTLRLRRNPVKLSLYRHFTNTLVFVILAATAFMIWSIKTHKLPQCITDWNQIWLDDAFWHLLFSCVLLVIMILWRPSMNKSRFAFSALLEEDGEDGLQDDQEPMLNDAYDVKMRQSVKQVNGPSQREKAKNKVEDDLKWIDENIPPSIDTALPGLLDSDEEIMTTKFEMSKME